MEATKEIHVQVTSDEDLLDRIRDMIKEEFKVHNPPEPSVKYFSRQETADLIGISLPSLDKYTRLGSIQGSRFGARVLYSQQAINDAITDIPGRKAS